MIVAKTRADVKLIDAEDYQAIIDMINADLPETARNNNKIIGCTLYSMLEEIKNDNVSQDKIIKFQEFIFDNYRLCGSMTYRYYV